MRIISHVHQQMIGILTASIRAASRSEEYPEICAGELELLGVKGCNILLLLFTRSQTIAHRTMVTREARARAPYFAGVGHWCLGTDLLAG